MRQLPPLLILTFTMLAAHGCGTGNTLPGQTPPQGDAASTGGSTGSHDTGGGTGGAAGNGGGTGGIPAPTACRQSDCAGQPVPTIGCPGGGIPTFTCERNRAGVCRLSGPQCPGNGGDGGDGGTPPPKPDAGPGPSCGAATCTANQYCCNASCGICAPRGAACIQVACEPPKSDAGSTGDACRVDSDCRLFDDYCTGCNCRALAKGDPDPTCSGPGVRCFVQPCLRKTAACVGGRCV
ncbi:MAG: hypothetical protein QOI66_2185, partial [Myxococcales bacterium]|nr:hypothetical protein [Myxococcales bacterium]